MVAYASGATATMVFTTQKLLIIHKKAVEVRVGIQMATADGTTRVQRLVEGGLAVRSHASSMLLDQLQKASNLTIAVLRRRRPDCKSETW